MIPILFPPCTGCRRIATWLGVQMLLCCRSIEAFWHDYVGSRHSVHA